MNQFFSAIEVHLDDRCLIDTAPKSNTVASLGVDNMIFRLNVEDHTEDRSYLDHQNTYDTMALAPDATHCLLGGKNNTLLKYSFADSSTETLLQTVGNITAIKYAPEGDYIAVGSQEGKTMILDVNSGSKQKCRPGHSGSICSITLSKSGRLLASIGQDQTILIYNIRLGQQPQQVARYSITSMESCVELTSSFHLNETILFVPGSTQLQRLQCIQNRWAYSKSSSIAHKTDIIMVLSVKANTLVTSTHHQVCIWNFKQQQKLFQIQQFSLTRGVQICGRFYGSRNDGKIYEYKRQIREEQPMDIEPQSANDKIQFEQQEQQGSKEEQIVQQQQAKEVVEYQQHKKSKADKMITCFPQDQISTATSLFDQKQFAFVNLYGYIILKIEGEHKIIEAELQGKRPQKFIIAKNKDYTYFSINELGVVYANEKEFGFKPSSQTSFEEWEVQWDKIQAVAMGSGWIAIASDSQIKMVDMACHQIRSMAFDRQIVALRAFENMLVVVYHEGVPFWGAQQLAMQLFLINSQAKEVIAVASTHVPLKRESLLRWFDFSREGMVFSQDDLGNIRAFSLQTSQWSALSVDEVDEMRKIWMIGIKDHKLLYWKTTDTDPEPTVAPRFTIKHSQFSILTVGYYPEGTQQTYQKLLWKRYVLDHEKARSRLWGSILKEEKNLFYEIRKSILKEDQIARKHIELDQQYFSLIEKYLRAKETMKAMLMSQNCIRSLDSIQRLVELFDYQNQRSLAIQLQEHAEERRKQTEYEQIQIFQFMKLRSQAERTIKPRSEDPMRRTAPKKVAESIPSFSQSFMSQESTENSIDKMNNSKISQQHSQNSENMMQAQNPFLKRKSNHESVEAKKKEISDQIEKFGIKQKVERKNISNKSISK